jgi:hypothetical protein
LYGGIDTGFGAGTFVGGVIGIFGWGFGSDG